MEASVRAGGGGRREGEEERERPRARARDGPHLLELCFDKTPPVWESLPGGGER